MSIFIKFTWININKYSTVSYYTEDNETFIYQYKEQCKNISLVEKLHILISYNYFYKESNHCFKSAVTAQWPLMRQRPVPDSILKTSRSTWGCWRTEPMSSSLWSPICCSQISVARRCMDMKPVSFHGSEELRNCSNSQNIPDEDIQKHLVSASTYWALSNLVCAENIKPGLRDWWKYLLLLHIDVLPHHQDNSLSTIAEQLLGITPPTISLTLKNYLDLK